MIANQKFTKLILIDIHRNISGFMIFIFPWNIYLFKTWISDSTYYKNNNIILHIFTHSNYFTNINRLVSLSIFL